MNRNLPLCCLLALLGSLAPTLGHAEMYKCVDGGHTTYSSSQLPGKNCKLLELDPLNTVAPTPPSTSRKPKPATSTSPGPEGFPRVDADTQKKRDDTRRKILETELANERRLLEEARQALAEGEAVRLGPERNNYQKFAERVQGLKDRVALHEKNVEALQKELASTK